MSKKEKQAYRKGIIETLETIAVVGFYVGIFLGFMAR